MLVPDTIIKSYIVTEKAANVSANLNQYTFKELLTPIALKWHVLLKSYST